MPGRRPQSPWKFPSGQCCSCLGKMVSSAVMDTSALDYELPEALVAQHPSEQRDGSRLLILDRSSRTIREDVFRNVGSYLASGDCLVLNDTKVVRARVMARKPTGGKVEILLLREFEPGRWEALVRPSVRVKAGTVVEIVEGITATVDEALPGRKRCVRFDSVDVPALLERVGAIPLPPYIQRTEEDPGDAERYQTVYARVLGAVAAPTAGLHFTESRLGALERGGVRRAALTLHVGYGTFKPVKVERLQDHKVDPEAFDFPEEAAALLNRTRAEGGRVVAVGTTTTRVLETQFLEGAYHAGQGVTDRYIFPPYTFAGVDVLQTNFHLPRSSLLALVAAFAGTEFVLEAYRYAVENRFRFYSYGDAMLIL